MSVSKKKGKNVSSAVCVCASPTLYSASSLWPLSIFCRLLRASISESIAYDVADGNGSTNVDVPALAPLIAPTTAPAHSAAPAATGAAALPPPSIRASASVGALRLPASVSSFFTRQQPGRVLSAPIAAPPQPGDGAPAVLALDFESFTSCDRGRSAPCRSRCAPADTTAESSAATLSADTAETTARLPSPWAALGRCPSRYSGDGAALRWTHTALASAAAAAAPDMRVSVERELDIAVSIVD